MGFPGRRMARRRRMAAGLVAGGIGAWLVGAAIGAGAEAVGAEDAPPAAVAPEAETEGPDAEAAGEADERSLDLETYWHQRLARAAKRIEIAREKAADAEADYSRARHDRNPRGEALAAIQATHAASERELREAESALPRLVEQARRAGVTPGVLRDYWDREPPEAPAATPGG